jgi:hypothetical protein
MAVLGGQKEIVKILLKRDIAVNARNPRGQTALDLAQQQLDRDVDEDFVSSLQRQDLDVAGFLKRYQEMATLLRDAGAKTADKLPPEPRGRSRPAPSKRRGRGKPGKQPDSTQLGVKDFLELMHYTEPQFAVIAVKAPIEKTAGAFVDFRNAKRWTRDVPRGAGARPGRVKASVTAAVKVKHNPWTVILRSIFRFGDNDHKLVVEDAKALSARLKTKAIAFTRESKAEAVGYDFFENGRLAEHAQWVEESSFCWFKSRFRRKPEKGELGEEFTDKVFRQQGIYLPACYPRYKKKGSWLCVEKVSAPAIERADIIVLHGRQKRRRK